MTSSVLSRRKARWITAVFFFVSGLITATWASRIPEVQHRLQLNDARWGMVLFAIPAGQVCGLPLTSWLIAKFNSRLIMVGSMILFALIFCLLGLSGAVWQIVPVLLLFGVCRSLVNISINTNALEVQRMYTKPIVSTFHGLWSLACFLAAGVGTFMIAHGVRPVWHFILMAGVVVCVSVIFKGKDFKNGKVAVERKPFFIAPDKYLFLLGMIAFCSMICEGTMFDWSVNYFKQVIQVPKEKVTMGYTSFILTMAIGRFIGDKVVARFGSVAILITNGLLMATGYAVAVLMPHVWTASAGFLLIGLGDSIIIPQVYTLAAKSKKMTAAYAIASVTMIGYAGFLSGPLLVGSISNAFGMQWSFALMGMVTVTITFLALRIKKYNYNYKPAALQV